MGDLPARLGRALAGRVAVLGMGNPDLGDDGFGVALAAALDAAGAPEVVQAGTTPEHHIQRLADAGYDAVLFLDAVELHSPPGSCALLAADEIRIACPQISTHKLSVGTLAQIAESGGATRAWLLGVQPASLRPGAGLSEPVRTALAALRTLLLPLLGAPAAPAAVVMESQ